MKKFLILVIFSFLIYERLNSQQLYVSNIAVFQGVDNNCTTPNVNGGDVSRSSHPIGARIEFDKPTSGYPAGCLTLCAWITAVVKTTADANMGVDELTFEIFKFRAGANPLDPASTPPIRTIPMYNVTSFDLRDCC